MRNKKFALRAMVATLAVGLTLGTASMALGGYCGAHRQRRNVRLDSLHH